MSGQTQHQHRATRLLTGLLLASIMGACIFWFMYNRQEAVDQRDATRFEESRADFDEAASAVLEATRGDSGFETHVDLPAEYANLSEYGAVTIYRPEDRGAMVVFWLLRGQMLGSSRSYVYCADGWTTADLSAWGYDEVRPLSGGWFLVQRY